MIKFSEETDGALPGSIADQLNEAIKKLSETQKEYLLQAVKDWINDQREYPRKDCRAEIMYSDNERLVQGTIMNISATGLYLQPESPFTIGQEVILTFEHPFAKKQIKMIGTVVRSDQNGIGVKFSSNVDAIL